MPHNLKARLGRIRTNAGTLSGVSPAASGGNKPDGLIPGEPQPDTVWPEWSEAGFKTLKRQFNRELPFPLPQVFPAALAILVPDIARLRRLPPAAELLFFDLETTGLSGGAGTVAFLAAFGRFTASAGLPGRIQITQYLLLDYPGEAAFIESAVKEFAASGSPLVVSYNGKCFDSQIFKTRCLMNGITPPHYSHADLLHPARRLWKRRLPDCSQSTIEVSVLGLDRSGDVSGAMAPDIWFSFLQSGCNRELLSICEHNARDITGLAALFLALGQIAESPLESRAMFNVDEESLALFWRQTLKKNPFLFQDTGSWCAETGELLLKNAAESGHPRAAIAMAKIAEWRLGDMKKALEYTDAALAAPDISGSLRRELETRRVRLEGKIARAGKGAMTE